MPPTTHLRLPVHIRLRLPVQRLGITRGLKRILGRFLRNVHLRQTVRGRRFCEQLHLAAPLHQRVQIAGLVDRAADGQQPVVAQDQPFAFRPQGGGQAGAFFLGEDDAVEFLRIGDVVSKTRFESQNQAIRRSEQKPQPKWEILRKQ
jgi:hypothetical protein